MNCGPIFLQKKYMLKATLSNSDFPFMASDLITAVAQIWSQTLHFLWTNNNLA